ncbi:MAG: VOC family protein [Opitutus sp.]|nr:VOC family protein [Opitutus sp.]
MIRIFLLLLAAAVSQPLFAADSGRKFQLTALYHVGYWVHDMEKSRYFYHDFLGYEEPYVLNRPDGSLQMVIMKVNERQVILLFNDPKMILPNGDNLDHLGLETTNNEALREYLISRGIETGTVHRARVGDLLLGAKDPDGNVYEVTQLEAQGQLMKHQGKSLPATRISDRLRSASLMVANLPAALHYYRDILGFKQIETDNPGLAAAHTVRLQVTDSTDYVDLVSYSRKSGTNAARRAPDYSLEVPDVAKALATLTARAKTLALTPPTPISISGDGKRQISMIDPDGVRVVLKEAGMPK